MKAKHFLIYIGIGFTAVLAAKTIIKTLNLDQPSNGKMSNKKLKDLYSKVRL